MVRQYKKKIGGRTYKNYSNATVEEALQKVVDEQWTVRKASKEYKIPFGTLYNRYKGMHVRSVGRPTLFTKQEEMQLVQSAAVCGDWGFPSSKADLQNLAKNYFEQQGKVIPWLKDNKPGIDWVDKLLGRHTSEVVKRVAANINRSRASVGEASLKEYFSNLEVTIEGVPATNIFNYDETNFANDPGRRFKIYRRGVKYPEQVCNFSKAATTVMFCGSASGILLPPYIIYRAEKLWNTWTQNGPKGYPCCSARCCSAGARYNRTHHGWMEALTFRDWFMKCFLPHAKTLEGRKVIIGDNLAAHFSDDVLKACEQNNIAFVCLVPNSTHLTQPLDVCFFRPMKIAWRSTLLKWKNKNPRLASLPKEEFPRLLQETLCAMDKPESTNEPGAISKDLISGFLATGMVPFNPEKVLCKIPGFEPQVPVENINKNLIDYLKSRRFGDNTSKPPKSKKKMLRVVPGKSVVHVTAEDNLSDIEEASSNESDSLELIHDEGASSDYQDKDTNHDNQNTDKEIIVNVGDFVLVKIKVEDSLSYKKFVASVISQSDTNEELVVSFLRAKIGKKENFYVYPVVPDESTINKTEIEAVIKPSVIQRGKYIF